MTGRDGAEGTSAPSPAELPSARFCAYCGARLDPAGRRPSCAEAARPRPEWMSKMKTLRFAIFAALAIALLAAMSLALLIEISASID